VSLEAYIWAANLPLSRCNGTPFRVLLQLADRADKLGYGAYPSVSNREGTGMADVLECSDRTVQRALRELLSLGLIREGDQRLVDHYDSRYRPTVYDVLTTALQVIESRGVNRVTPAESRGDRSVHSGVTTGVAQRTVQEPSYQDSPRHLTLVTAREGEESEAVLVEMRESSGSSLSASDSPSVLGEGRQDRSSHDEEQRQQRSSRDGQGEHGLDTKVRISHGAHRTGVAS